MSGLFRSEDMQYVRLTMTNEAAHDTIRELGNFGKLHIVDLNEDAVAFSDNYTYYKKRAVACNAWDRRIRKLEEQMNENNVDIPNVDVDFHDMKVDDVVTAIKNVVDPLEQDLSRNLEFKEKASSEVATAVEHSIVLETLKPQLFQMREDYRSFEDERRRKSKEQTEVELDNLDRSDLRRGLLSDTGGAGYDLDNVGRRGSTEMKGGAAAGRSFHNYVCGTIPLVQQPLFERMLFRVSRGNAYARFHILEEKVQDPVTGEFLQKAVFYVVYIGQVLQRRIEKICDFFRASRYDIPDSPQEVDQRLAQLAASKNERDQVLLQTSKAIRDTLGGVAWDDARGYSPIRNWQEALRRERIICDAFKRCVTPNNSIMITAEGWIPTEDLEDLRLACREAVRASGAQVAVVQPLQVKDAPPTYFKTNKFTSNFQDIVDTYGIPRYKEVNPGLFTIVTFPFLFGIMYGDVGHGFLVFCGALFMVLNEQNLAIMKKKGTLGEIPTMMFNGRYLILSMSICAMYCGSIYNDTVSVPTDLFGTTWFYPGGNMSGSQGPNSAVWATSVYPYGVDPGWYHTENELTFFNTLKMKISVTFGVIQMTFGIFLSLANHIYFNDTISILFEFVPQILFMLSTFGYMIFLIFFKFVTVDHNSVQPNLIQTMISMFLSPGSVPKDKQLYEGQASIQVFLVLIAVIAIPWMLLPKPMLLNYYHKKQMAEKGQQVPTHELLEDDEEKQGGSAGGHDDHDDEEHFDFGEHFIHQAIHTIEFVLGCVSNTASYLRLWALSLAHAELSNVFWEKLIMEYGVNMGSPLFAFVGFAAWAGATFAVLLCMDTLECFLHALRLHWVEFQNKFYHADGYAFEPFNFIPEEE